MNYNDSYGNVIRTGWLSPTGEFIPCSAYSHISTAEKLYKKLCKIADDKFISNSDIELLKMGYVSITILSMFDHGFQFSVYRKLTPEQITFLEPYYLGEYGLGFTETSRIEYEYQKEEL